MRRSRTGPQKKRNGDRLVAAEANPEAFETVQNLRREESLRSLAGIFSEIREICEHENYQLDIGKRENRKNWMAEDS